jgi:cell fate (sporulation/competence/biofilm development) regulator YmcA (YheA/YmcA/DUF963 family)
MKYTKSQIDSIGSKLKTMPVVDKNSQKVSKQEAIRILAKEIFSLQKRGYTLEKISELLSSDGLGISTSTLKNYLQRAKSPKI